MIRAEDLLASRHIDFYCGEGSSRKKMKERARFNGGKLFFSARKKRTNKNATKIEKSSNR